MMLRIHAALLIACLLVACGTTKGERKKAKAEISAKIDVDIVAQDVINDVGTTARRVTKRTEDREIRRLMVNWQVLTSEYCLRALRRPDPRYAFVDIWTMLAHTRAYIQVGRGAEKVGDQKEFLTSELDAMIARMRRRASAFLKKKDLDAVDAAVQEYATSKVTEGGEIVRPRGATTADTGMMEVLAAVPEGIFSLGGGVKDTAVSVHEVARAVEQGVDVVGVMPKMVRLQTELLLYALEEDPVINRVLDDVSRVAKATEQAGNTIERMPEELQEATSRLVKEIEETQPAFQKTLQEARAVVADSRTIAEEARGAINEAEPVVTKIESATGKAAEAGAAWEGAFEQLNILVGSEDPEPAEPGEPFDFKDVVTTAESATMTAQDVRAAVQDLRAVVEGDAADKRVAAFEASTVAAIDRVTRSGVMLILTFFGALLVYKFVARWIPVRGT